MKISLFFAFFFAFFAALSANFLFPDFSNYGSMILIFFISFFVFLLVIQSLARNKFAIQPRKHQPQPQLYLEEKEKIIFQRVADLSRRGHKIDAVIDKIKENDSYQLQEIRLKLLTAREIIMNHFARYELQKRKIQLVRLQNEITPYLQSFHRLNDVETENGLAAVEYTQNEIGKIRQDLTSYNSIEFPSRTLPEKRNFLTQLDETENSGLKLREALLSRQAARALRSISPITESRKLLDAKPLIHAAETFNIQTTITDFSESFENLEREYQRILAENEVEMIDEY